jgi:hypothetical protein
MNANTLMREHEITIAKAAILIELLTDAGDTPFIWGLPGLGKSDIVHQLGGKKGWPVIEFHAALRETVDLRGIPIADLKTGKTRWLPPDELPNEERDGPNGYLFLDEFNQASPQMQAALGGLILYGTIGEYKLPKGWRIIAAGNRMSDKASAQRMPTQVRNRFQHVYVTPDVDAWVNWANANNVAPEVVAFVRLRRELIHMMPRGDENAFPSPRSLTKAAKHVHAPQEHRLRLFASHIGDGPAAELDGFIELYRSIGALDDIVNDPDNANIPTEASLRFAVCTGLGRIATRKNLNNIIRYAKRLPREFEVLVVADSTVRDPSLKNTPAYGKWACDNQDLTIQAA